jgi:hypothetical protein
MKSLRILLLVIATASLACAGDREFKGVVHAMESNYGVHHMHIPLLGVVMFLTRPAGFGGMKLAVFEGFPALTDTSEVDRLVEGALGPAWHPFVRVRSRGGKGNGESTVIYMNPAEGSMKMLVVSVESSEATVVELKVNQKTMREWFHDTDEDAKAEFIHRRVRSSD